METATIRQFSEFYFRVSLDFQLINRLVVLADNSGSTTLVSPVASWQHQSLSYSCYSPCSSVPFVFRLKMIDQIQLQQCRSLLDISCRNQVNKSFEIHVLMLIHLYFQNYQEGPAKMGETCSIILLTCSILASIPNLACGRTHLESLYFHFDRHLHGYVQKFNWLADLRNRVTLMGLFFSVADNGIQQDNCEKKSSV